VIGREGEASRTLQWDEVSAAAPEVVLVACCGLSVARTQQDLAELSARALWRELPAVRAGRVLVADGHSFFSRPGPGLVDSLELLAHALHPNLHPPHASERLVPWTTR
ncbi:MAG TPA: cobalamin-binding protein, partial [Myxococcota bacterium]|nr:cobalamin-binding protein [Myxococcota bacterium]